MRASGADADALRTHAAALGLPLHTGLDEAAVAVAAVRRFAAARAAVRAGV